MKGGWQTSAVVEEKLDGVIPVFGDDGQEAWAVCQRALVDASSEKEEMSGVWCWDQERWGCLREFLLAGEVDPFSVHGERSLGWRLLLGDFLACLMHQV